MKSGILQWSDCTLKSYGDPQPAALIWLKSHSQSGVKGTTQRAINVYFEDKPGRRAAVNTVALSCRQRIEANIPKFPELATGAALVV
jgi:hypothetical protein